MSNSSEVLVAKSLEEIYSLKAFWEKLQHHPNSDFSQYVWSTEEWNPKTIPYVLYLKDRTGEIKSILVGRREIEPIDIKIGYFTVYRPLVKKITFIYEGLIGNSSKDICNIFVKRICDEIKKGGTDVVWFNSLKRDSFLFKAATTIPNTMSKDRDFIFTKHWAMHLPRTTKEFWEGISPKHRYLLRRYSRDLEKKYPAKIKLQNFSEVDQVEDFCIKADQVSKKTYQRALGVGFVDSTPMRSRIKKWASRGQLRAIVYLIENDPVAFWVGQIYKKTFYTSYTGYDQKYRQYSIGTLVLIRLIENLIQNDRNHVEQIDFGLGDAEYKQRFGNISWEEASVFIYPLTFKGVQIKIARKVTNRSQRIIERILKKYNYEKKVKLFWRRRKAASLKDSKKEQ